MPGTTSFFAVEFPKSAYAPKSADAPNETTERETYFYWGPSMEEQQWGVYLTKLRAKAHRDLKKELGTYTPLAFKFRVDKLLKERGFNKHIEDSYVCHDHDTAPLLDSIIDDLIIRFVA